MWRVVTANEYLYDMDEINRIRELAMGVLRESPAPFFSHQSVVLRIARVWSDHAEPLKLGEALQSAAAHGRPVLVDCLTLWLSNLMGAGADLDEATDELVQALEGYAAPVVFVSNEVGLGIVPDTPLGRAFRDAQGRLNLRVAERADRVILMAAGLPLIMKDRPRPRL